MPELFGKEKEVDCCKGFYHMYVNSEVSGKPSGFG
jgi:hypothetical protein